MKATTIRSGLAMLGLAALIGFLGLQLLPAQKEAQAPSLGSLPGRHLEKPWWEAVSSSSAGGETTIVIPADVLFPTGSAALSAQGKEALTSLVSELRGAISIEVAGCTDSVGGIDSPSNLELSQARADAAVALLESAGISSSLFHTDAWADTHPASVPPGVDQATANALNRRIVVVETK
jgi:flagellar motor protein MotB